MKKILKSFNALVVSTMMIMCSFIPVSADTIVKNTNSMFEGVKEINLSTIKKGDIIYLLRDGDKNISLEFIEVKPSSAITTRASKGDSGWSGGTIPNHYVKMMARANDGPNSFEYTVNADKGDIVDAHSLTYSVYAYTISNTSLTHTARRASLTFQATLKTPWNDMHNFGGYINFEVNETGNVKVSWSI